MARRAGRRGKGAARSQTFKIQARLEVVGVGMCVLGQRLRQRLLNFSLCLSLPPPAPKQIKMGEVQIAQTRAASI